MFVAEAHPHEEGKNSTKDDNSSGKMSSNFSASSSSSRREGTTKTARHHYHGERPSTLHHGGENSFNSVEGAANGSVVSAQCSVPKDGGESAHSWSVGHDHISVLPGADIGMSGMILLPDPTHANIDLTGANGRGEGREKTRRGDNTRSNRNSNRLGVGVDKEGRASSSSLAGGKEPPIRSLGGLTMTTLLKLVTITGTLCSAILVWIQYDIDTGRLCPKGKNKPCLDSPVSMALLTIAKMCAGALFPSIIVSVLTKCYATKHFLNNSWLSLVVNFEPTHELHNYYGVVTMICSVVHSLAHVVILVCESETKQLHTSAMKRSGVAALVLLLLTALPMAVGFLKLKWTFELRKLIHLAFIPFVIAVCFHGARLRVLGIILLVWYLVDRFYFTTRMTFLIDRPSYKIVGRGTLVRFNLPDGYHFKSGAYVQVNCPAISSSEWHPFSVFPVPGSKPRAGFHIDAVGDWTKELFRLSLENPHMPLWITAAQPSVLEQSLYYDNVILVCTGTGITPGVCLIERFASRKNIHLLWLSREAGMVAMFEKQIRLVSSTVNLTGSTGADTKKRLVDLLAPSKSEVVAITTAASLARSGSPTSPPSSSDLSVLEAAEHPTVSLRDYPGALRDENGHNREDQKEERDSDFDGRWRSGERSSFGVAASPVRGSPIPGREPPQKSSRGSGSGNVECVEENRLRDHARDHFSGRGRRAKNERKLRAKRVGARRSLSRDRSHVRAHSGSRSSSHGRNRRNDHIVSGGSLWPNNGGGGKSSRGLHPVSVCFGRPDIERYIIETVEGTAVTAEWADQAVIPARGSAPPSSRQRQALVRLNTNQRILKKDLMSADLSVVAKKPSSVSSDPDGVGASGTVAIGQGDRKIDNRKWLVLYCGGNIEVEKELATACSKLKITWKKEYFSAW